MKLQIRFLLLLTILFLASAIVLAAQRDFEVGHTQRILSSELKQRETYFNNVVNLDGQALETLSVDYSFWDDFVNFIKTDNLTFAHQNLDTGLSTFNAYADWVYKPNGSLLYGSTATPGIDTPKSLNLPPAFFQQLSQRKFTHFYYPYHGSIVEIRAATVVPSDDTQHVTNAQGYWLVGRILGTSYTDTLSQLTQNSVSIGSPGGDTKNRISATGISFGTSLHDWKGAPVASLLATSQVPVISDLNHTYGSELAVLAIFSVAIILIIALATWRFVLQPVNLITSSIVRKRPDLLGDLSESKNEFGSLAATVQAFFQQQTVIAETKINRQELETKHKQTTTFLAATVHELRSPVESIHQSANTLATLMLRQAPPAELKRHLTSITDQIARTQLLLNDLQSASEGKAMMRFTMQDFDFGAFLDREIEQIRPLVKQQINLTNQTRTYVRGDPARLGQVLTVLMHTAALRSPENSAIEVIAQTEDNQVLMTIHDNGPIISAAEQQHIFDEPVQSGTRLPEVIADLPISKRIVEQMGGRLWLMSDPQKGTYIHMAMPGITVNASPETFTTTVE
ncbi:MAG: ATP-binding protein [Candidatus Saccharimonadales bacterium]